jgi:hypothetical protein
MLRASMALVEYNTRITASTSEGTLVQPTHALQSRVVDRRSFSGAHAHSTLTGIGPNAPQAFPDAVIAADGLA